MSTNAAVAERIMHLTTNEDYGSSILSGCSILGYHPDWKRVSKTAGYPIIFCPDHPKAWKIGYVYLHRIIAEIKIGRLLLGTEVVHHKNEIKTDFSWENIEVVASASEHTKKHIKPPKMIVANCKHCGCVFTRRKGQSAVCCSRSCNGKYNAAHGKTPSRRWGRVGEIRHGTVNAYHYHKCRCRDCRDAIRDAKRVRRAKQIADSQVSK